MSVGDTYIDADGVWLVTGVNPSGEVTSAVLTEPSQEFKDSLPEPVEPAPVINRGDLLLAIFDVLGKETARALARDYPDAVLAIDHGNWPVLAASMADMLADGALTQQQAADLSALFQQFGVSVG